jgi:hypothetical protein
LAQVTKDRYKKVLWKNVVPVYVCQVCGKNDNSEDEMILHVLTHEPDKKQEKILNEILEKGVNNGTNSINSSDSKNPVRSNKRRRG